MRSKFWAGNDINLQKCQNAECVTWHKLSLTLELQVKCTSEAAPLPLHLHTCTIVEWSRWRWCLRLRRPGWSGMCPAVAPRWAEGSPWTTGYWLLTRTGCQHQTSPLARSPQQGGWKHLYTPPFLFITDPLQAWLIRSIKVQESCKKWTKTVSCQI